MLTLWIFTHMHPWGTLGADSKYLKYSLTELLTVPSLAPAPHSTGIYPKSLFFGKTQCPTMKLNKRSLPKPTTPTGWKLIPHRSKISMNWNLLHLDPIIKYFLKVFFLSNNFFFRNKKSLSKKQLLFSFLCIEKQKNFLEQSEIFWNFLFLKL